MKIAVIGSGGYMGRHLVTKLVDRGHQVFGYSSSDGSGIDPGSGLLPERFRFPSKMDVVVYLSQSPMFRDFTAYADHVLAVNVLSAIRAAIIALTGNVKRFIYLSTGNVYAPSFAPLAEDAPVRRDDGYALSKIQAEEALDLFRREVEIIVLRPFGVYGPGQTGRLVPNLIDSIKAGRPITLHPRPDRDDDFGGLRVSLCFINDATDILIRIVETGGPARLNLAGPETLSVRFMAETIGELLGRTAVFDVSNRPRTFDLVADTENLVQSFSPSFTLFEVGVAETVEANSCWVR